MQEHGGRRTFVATNAGYRLEIHPPRDWLEELLEAWRTSRSASSSCSPTSRRPKAEALAGLLDLEAQEDGTVVEVGETLVRFLPGGPAGRPELHGELFL